MSATSFELEAHRQQGYGRICTTSRSRSSSFSTDAEPLLNYGAKLRLLMADPMKGHDLREAISQLKTALKEAIKNAI